ncbi:hypothetical protein [Saccharothrix variisporea]|uniref:NACHT domain-containing protein n=1 Tax=Saccharothrix variisporea TaxID=543527 RepID=A0A495XDG8_9PSEU|nr:hypothetical protein [Saccharothrix variisporea]RKT72521.1 hypothetical protein DFJ66_5835 [Saccharothrix variisporea]
MAGWRRWLVALIVLVVGTTVMALAARSSGGLESAGRVGALIVGLTPLAWSVVAWARRAPAVPLPVSTPEQVAAARRQLADQVLAQWREEIALRRLDDPGPLAVRWRFADADVMDHPGHVLGRDPMPRSAGRLRFTGRTDRVGDLAAGFRTLPRRRLVVLGAAGSGKTTMTLLLVRELLLHAEDDDPVPVLVPLSDWDADAEPLGAWLARRLAEDYPALRADVFGPDAPAALVARRMVLPVLDGLDEVAAPVRSRVLGRLNEVAADPVVLTCRSDEYRAAVAAGGVLAGAAVIESCPLTPADAAEYVTRCLPPRPGDGWPVLLDELTGDPGGPVARALSTPLALWLLRKVYVEPHADPAGLCDRSRFPTGDAVLEHLLDHVVGALVRSNPPDRRHPFRPRRPWPPLDATRRLAFLAHHLDRSGSRDLAWWHLHRAAPRPVAVIAGVVAAVGMGVATGVHDGLKFGWSDGVVGGVVVGVGVRTRRGSRAGAGGVARSRARVGSSGPAVTGRAAW